MANDDITWVRPEHRAASAAWRKYRDFCKGAEAVKAAGNKYLPYLDPTDKSTRNRKRNEDYLSRAVFYAIAGNTKIGMLGMAYRKDPTFNGPEKLKYLLDNADGAGTSIYQQSQLVAENVLEVAREGLYVDYAEASDEAIILRYPAENIINWRTKRINGRDQLVLVVLRECVEEPDGYAYKDEIQYRELALEEGRFICRVWRRAGGTASGTYTVDSEYHPKPKGKDYWDEIPFTFVGAQNNDPTIDDSPLAALVEINHGHSGMPVYMVAIQQGGQLRDSFGGVGNALKAMLSMVTPARVAIGGLAGAVLIAAKAGSDYFTAYDEINKAIIRTGNIAGTSALQIMASSQSIAASTGATVGTVQGLMTELVGMGSLTQQQLEKAAGSTALPAQDTTSIQLWRGSGPVCLPCWG